MTKEKVNKGGEVLMMAKSIETAPKKSDINEILAWLKKEKDCNKYGEGFYNNNDIIIDSFESGKAITLKYENENIGLITWSDYDILVNIDIFVIHPNYRRNGFGEYFYRTVSDYFKAKGFKAIKLFCAPKTSENFWKKMGLVKLYNCGYTEHELTYYDVLVEVASTTDISKSDKIELWNVEPYEATEKPPQWTWFIDICEDKLKLPIIQPCNCNWNLSWSRNGVVIKEEKVKYFTEKDYELFRSNFLYIEELKN